MIGELYTEFRGGALWRVIVGLSLMLAACAPSPEVPAQGGRALIWNRDSAQIAWYAEGKPQSTLLAGRYDRVAVCASTPKWAIVYGGVDGGGSGSPVYSGAFWLVDLVGNVPALRLENGSAMGCEPTGRTAFSADGEHFAWLQYTAEAGLGAEYALGTLLVYDVRGVPVGKVEGVADFEFEGAKLWVSLFSPASLSIMRYSFAAGELTPVSDATPITSPALAATCSYVNVRLAVPFYAVGERCTTPAGYASTVYRMGNPSTVSSERRVAGGKFYPGTGTHTLLALPDQKTLLWIFPDGRQVDTGTLVKLDAGTQRSESLSILTLTDQSPASSPRRFQKNATGNQIAYVALNGQGGETLWLWQLDRPDTEPAQVNDLFRSNRINAIAWSADGARLAYLADGSQPSLSFIDQRGERRDAVKGVFHELALSPDGLLAYTVQKSGDGYTLWQFRLSDGAKTAIINGAVQSPVVLVVR